MTWPLNSQYSVAYGQEPERQLPVDRVIEGNHGYPVPTPENPTLYAPMPMPGEYTIKTVPMGKPGEDTGVIPPEVFSPAEADWARRRGEFVRKYGYAPGEAPEDYAEAWHANNEARAKDEKAAATEAAKERLKRLTGK